MAKRKETTSALQRVQAALASLRALEISSGAAAIEAEVVLSALDSELLRWIKSARLEPVKKPPKDWALGWLEEHNYLKEGTSDDVSTIREAAWEGEYEEDEGPDEGTIEDAESARGKVCEALEILLTKHKAG